MERGATCSSRPFSLRRLTAVTTVRCVPEVPVLHFGEFQQDLPSERPHNERHQTNVQHQQGAFRAPPRHAFPSDRWTNVDVDVSFWALDARQPRALIHEHIVEPRWQVIWDRHRAGQ
jgi:hypothetical protein